MAPQRPVSLQLLLEEKRRRELARRPKTLVADAAFPKQREFIKDPSRFKAVICSRRSGKSYAVGLYLFQEALAHPDSSCLYLVKTHDQAKKSMFRQVLRKIARTHGIAAEFNDSTLEVKLPNGSIIYLLGADSSQEQQDRVRGSNFRLVIVDEAGHFRHDLESFYHEVLRPLTWDTQGTICLIGTPYNARNFFHKVTTGLEPGWKVYRWLTSDNPHMAKQYADEIEWFQANDPLFLETAKFRQEYLGEWVVDESSLIYRFNESRNVASELPKLPGRWTHIIGIDLGYNDDTAWVVCAYNDHDPTLYVRETKKAPGLILSNVAEFTRHLIAKYDPHAIVVDNAAKQSVEELKQRYCLPLEPAEKQGKADAIMMLNSDLVTGKIKLLPGTEDLSDEWSELVWDEKKLPEKYEEHPSCPNHLSDAMLYAFRRARNYYPAPIPVVHRPGTNEAMEAFWEQKDAEWERQRRLDAWDRW